MKRIITYSIIALLQASVALAQTSPKPKLQKREKYEWQGEIPLRSKRSVRRSWMMRMRGQGSFMIISTWAIIWRNMAT